MVLGAWRHRAPEPRPGTGGRARLLGARCRLVRLLLAHNGFAVVCALREGCASPMDLPMPPASSPYVRVAEPGRTSLPHTAQYATAA